MRPHRVIRALAAFTLFTMASSGSLVAQSSLPGYGPTNARYRVVTSAQTSQVMMGQTQEGQTRTEQVFTVSVSRAGSALTQVMTLDSVTMNSTLPVPMPDVSSALGMKLTGAMDADGKVTTSAVTDKMGAASASPFATNMRSFLPRLKVGAAPGSSWTDSATSITKQNGADVTTTQVTTYTFAGDTTMTGVRASKLTASTVGKVSGSGNQQGADFTIGGTINGRATYVIDAAGVFLGAEVVSDASMLVEVPAASMTIPITTKTTTTVTRAP